MLHFSGRRADFQCFDSSEANTECYQVATERCLAGNTITAELMKITSQLSGQNL